MAAMQQSSNLVGDFGLLIPVAYGFKLLLRDMILPSSGPLCNLV